MALVELKPSALRRLRDQALRQFWPRVFDEEGRLETPCRIWGGALSADGYGIAQVGRKMWRTHRLAWVLEYGEIDDALVLDHLCRERACCNVKHLEPVTLEENTRRGAASRREEAGV